MVGGTSIQHLRYEPVQGIDSREGCGAAEMDSFGLDWIGLDWIGLEIFELVCFRVVPPPLHYVTHLSFFLIVSAMVNMNHLLNLVKFCPSPSDLSRKLFLQISAKW